MKKFNVFVVDLNYIFSKLIFALINTEILFAHTVEKLYTVSARKLI